MAQTNRLPSHISPMISPLPLGRSSPILTSWADLEPETTPSTPTGIPHNLLSPGFTPPLTPSQPLSPQPEPEIIPVDTSAEPHSKGPRLLQRLPKVECLVRARIPTTTGAEMFLHLYANDSDDKEHLALVFGDSIRSRSLFAERPGETEQDRIIRGAYTGTLRPGRTSSRRDDEDLRRKVLRQDPGDRSRRTRSSSLRNVQAVDEAPRLVSPSSEENSMTSEPAQPPLVRIHSECYTGETVWSRRCDCGEQLDEAARLMSTASSLHDPHPPSGVIVYLRQEGRGIGLASKLKAYNLQDLGNDTVDANLLLRHPADARTYGLATAILVDLGLGTDADREKEQESRGIRLLTNNMDKVRAVEGPDRQVRVVSRVAMVPLAWRTNGEKGVRGAELQRYLEAKVERMGHVIHD